MKPLEHFLKPTQNKLFSELCRMYKGRALSKKKSFILVSGEVPIMLLAHLDTVHQHPVKQICKTADGNILMSPQGIGGDDRCGVYALVKIYESAEKKPWLLFTCDEEIGGVGAREFCAQHHKGNLPKGVDGMKLLVELDRKGKNDAVYYNCANNDFEKYITSQGFVTQHGSFSDISLVAPELGVAAVNLSSGYYNAHTEHEYINLKQLNAVIEKVVSMISDAAKDDFPRYEYIEKVWGYMRTVGIRRYHKRNSENERERDKIPENLSEDLVDEYYALLSRYSEAELNRYVSEFGDMALHLLYEDEYGVYHDSHLNTPDGPDWYAY